MCFHNLTPYLLSICCLDGFLEVGILSAFESLDEEMLKTWVKGELEEEGLKHGRNRQAGQTVKQQNARRKYEL